MALLVAMARRCATRLLSHGVGELNSFSAIQKPLLAPLWPANWAIFKDFQRRLPVATTAKAKAASTLALQAAIP